MAGPKEADFCGDIPAAVKLADWVAKHLYYGSLILVSLTVISFLVFLPLGWADDWGSVDSVDAHLTVFRDRNHSPYVGSAFIVAGSLFGLSRLMYVSMLIPIKYLKSRI